MKIGIVGGGISGTFLAIKIKEYHPDYDVEIFEHNPKLIRKVYATGNGKCNFANSGDLKDKELMVLAYVNSLKKLSIKDYSIYVIFGSCGIVFVLIYFIINFNFTF